MKRAWTGIGIAALGLVLSLVLIEVVYRLFQPFINNSKAAPSDRPRVYFFSAESGNTRDYYYEKKKPANTFRIIVVGDSFAYGYGNLFDDAFPKRLERILNLNNSETKVEVLNFSTPGHSTFNEEQVVRRALAEWEPDLLLLEITLNDSELKKFNLRKKRSKSGSIVMTGGVYDYWKSLAFVVGRIKNTQSVYEYKRYFRGLWEKEDTLKNFRVALRQIMEAAKASNTKLGAIIFPLVTFPIDETYPFEHAHAVIREMLQNFGIPYIDLLASYWGMDPYRLQARPGLDPHPNEIAHRIAAEALYIWLKNQNFIPQDTMVNLVAKKRIGPTKLRKRRARRD